MTDEVQDGGKDPYLQLLDRQIRKLSRIDDGLLVCRIGAAGHNWQMVQPDWKPTVSGVQAVAKQCLICETIVRYNISKRYGEILGSVRYEYPDGYTLPSSGERIRPQAVRAEWVKRMRRMTLPEMVQLTHISNRELPVTSD